LSSAGGFRKLHSPSEILSLKAAPREIRVSPGFLLTGQSSQQAQNLSAHSIPYAKSLRHNKRTYAIVYQGLRFSACEGLQGVKKLYSCKSYNPGKHSI
jgi:hypothetical protein